AAIVTPPDVMSQLFLAIPICILYEVGILFAKIIGKQRQQILE
ncbi:MAG TPA: twin-arginine translocase subunit TatC, partial [Limnobacter sp.]|nr:twin-arginine translocase subunit TatC [Limnobacter sp.]